MTTDQITYVVFGAILILALVFDLGLLSKKNQKVTIKQALYQTFFWVGLALSFCVFMWIENGQKPALEYLSAYLMEWSLSIDNIFVFILIFSAFSVKEKNYGRVLLIGILMAILFRVIFITLGVALVERFHWILYVFGVFLIYTGYKMFASTEEEEFDPKQSKVYKFVRRFLPVVPHDGDGKFTVRIDGKKFYTTLFVVVIMLAAIDLVFALDSIPAVMGIVDTKTEGYQETARLVIYTSNIFAVLGLRSLFFLLRGAVSKFDYLQQGIAIVLVFIGLKMLCEHWINEWLDKTTQVFISLAVILCCIFGSIFYSIFMKKKGVPPDVDDPSTSS
ncbi:MAG: tellurium resistance protein TerC [Sphingobacteriales bacterium SCN 48-20]|jgi:tellurite resistance protein TerC|uniref:TerC/Alx family metal homeostasis membrane protein n=1 Tax=Terrimonas ferruginea TaxID=249 RepID=UPI00086C9962|nr:TerC/Alx family metal homeostasis membrane protein [Terrimonas ferruginea]MBN8785140.1 TerC/Alx family metal homeostasis membrane protein [Terrimonas ferruginea]ODT90829.1 MAG: tellurium resistance protein TerC [Sphingobacteriales bacterium SCN 48-20]OJW41552.1 MAG: tellurium resistance protein TerC [Sphingobacteriales bacterium 48-107]